MSATKTNKQNEEIVLKYTSLLIDNSPKEIQPYLKKTVPYIIELSNFQ
jgi:hypothetical protein